MASSDNVALDENTRRITRYGELIGSVGTGGSYVWYSVPYAKPPVGDLRWRAPQLPDAWAGLRPAGEKSKPCKQVVSYPGPVEYPEVEGTVIGQEDCLYVSIWSPPLSQSEISSLQCR